MNKTLYKINKIINPYTIFITSMIILCVYIGIVFLSFKEIENYKISSEKILSFSEVEGIIPENGSIHGTPVYITGEYTGDKNIKEYKLLVQTDKGIEKRYLKERDNTKIYFNYTDNEDEYRIEAYEERAVFDYDIFKKEIKIDKDKYSFENADYYKIYLPKDSLYIEGEKDLLNEGIEEK